MGIPHHPRPRHTPLAVSDRDAYRVLHVQADAHPAVIRAAYRALAALYHPDRSDSGTASSERMAELNEAYAKVRTDDARAAYDEERRRKAHESVVVMPVRDRAEAVRARAEQAAAATPPADGAATDKPKAGVVDFGRYQGWTIRSLARHDPDYLRWLSRHSAGMRFRAEISAALAAAPTGPTVSEKVFGRR